MQTNEARGKTGAVIAAAGTGSRMGDVDKVFAPLAGQPLLAFVLTAFQDCPSVDEIVVVLARRNLEQGRRLVRGHNWSKVVAVCSGGSKRQDSVREGLRRLTDCDWVVIHDGARPCVDADLIERGLIAAREGGAAIAAVPVKDTIKIVSRRGLVQETPARQSLWIAQTPQVFRSDLISEAYLGADDKVTDDATLVEQLGHRVQVYMGSYRNVKVTTPEDLTVAEALLKDSGKTRLQAGGACASESASMPTA
jgi:2-C-methyl-D-erythritol 4-phosphate cytidylyltransferase